MFASLLYRKRNKVLRQIDDAFLAGEVAEMSRASCEDNYYRLTKKCQGYFDAWHGPFYLNGLELVAWTTNRVFTIKQNNEPLVFITFEAIESGHGHTLSLGVLQKFGTGSERPNPSTTEISS